MATIVFTNNRTLEVAPKRAIRLMMIRRGQLEGSKEIKKFLKKVKAITFDTTVRPEPVSQGRLPYVDK